MAGRNSVLYHNLISAQKSEHPWIGHGGLGDLGHCVQRKLLLHKEQPSQRHNIRQLRVEILNVSNLGKYINCIHVFPR